MGPIDFFYWRLLRLLLRWRFMLCVDTIIAYWLEDESFMPDLTDAARMDRARQLALAALYSLTRGYGG